MPWRILLQNWLRQMAQQRVMEAVADAASASAARGANPDGENTAEQAEIPQPTPVVCHVGLVFALSMESGRLEDRLSGLLSTRANRLTLRQGGLAGRGLTLAIGGVGQQAAAEACEKLIAGHRPAWVISAGFAGGLDARLNRYDVLMVDSVVAAQRAPLEIDLRVDPASLEQMSGVHVGRLLTGDHIVRQPEEKRRLGQQHQALAVDMETWAVADVCRRHQTRFLAVRVITDTVDDELPPDLEHLIQQKSVVGQMGAVAGALWRRPKSFQDMLRLQEHALQASERLARFLVDMIRQLPIPHDTMP